MPDSSVDWSIAGRTADRLATLPNDYYRALSNDYEQRNRDLFANGLPTDAGGNLDFTQMFKQILQAGGTGGITPAANALQLGIAAQAPQANADAIRFLAAPDTSGNQGGNSSGGVSLPSPQNVAPRAASPSYIARLSAAESGNNPNAQSSTSNATGAYQIMPDTWSRLSLKYPQYLTADGINDPKQQQLAVRLLTAENSRDLRTNNIPVNDANLYVAHFLGSSDARNLIGALNQNPDAPALSVVSPAAVNANRSMFYRPNGQPVTVGELYQELSRRISGAGDQNAALQNTAPAATDPTLGGLVPNGWNPNRYLTALQVRAANPSLSPQTQKLYQAKIEAIQKVLTQRAELTPEQKNAAAAGMPLLDYSAANAETEARGKQSGELYAKRYESLQDTGIKAAQVLPQLEYAQKLMQDPNFYSGIGENYNLALKRIAVALGGDPTLAGPQEAFRKIVSESILQQLGQLKGLGQIRNPEIRLAEQASASPGNTPAANQVMLTIAQRLNQRAADIAAMAQRYNNGRLDSGFDRIVSWYDANNPIFSPDEIDNWRSVLRDDQKAAGSKSTVSRGAGLPRVSSPADAAKLPKGTRFIDPNGVTRVVP